MTKPRLLNAKELAAINKSMAKEMEKNFGKNGVKTLKLNLP